MALIVRLMVVLALAVLPTACAIPMGSSYSLYVPAAPPVLTVTNAISHAGDIFVNGVFTKMLLPGESKNIGLPYWSNTNMIVTFKAFTLDDKGGKVFRGIATQVFQNQGAHQNQFWNVTGVQNAQ